MRVQGLKKLRYQYYPKNAIVGWQKKYWAPNHVLNDLNSEKVSGLFFSTHCQNFEKMPPPATVEHRVNRSLFKSNAKHNEDLILFKPNYSFESARKKWQRKGKRKKKSNANWRNKAILTRGMKRHLLPKINPFAKNEGNYDCRVPSEFFLDNCQISPARGR